MINELVHKPEDQGSDWIELFNICREEMDLAGWTLSDEDGQIFQMGQGGCQHAIPALSYMVLTRNDPCSFSFGLGSADQVLLVDERGQHKDSTQWEDGDAPKGRSWARIPDGIGPWLNTDPTPGEFNGLLLQMPQLAAQSADEVTLVISEIANKPLPGSEDWIELHNYGERSVKLSGLRLTDSRTGVDDGFYFGATGCEELYPEIPAGGILVLERDQPCSFTFGLGDSDEAHLFFDAATEIDSTRFGPEFGGPIIPYQVTWCRNPVSSDDVRTQQFTTCIPSKGFSNGREVTGQELDQLVSEMVAQQSLGINGGN